MPRFHSPRLIALALSAALGASLAPSAWADIIDEIPDGFPVRMEYNPCILGGWGFPEFLSDPVGTVCKSWRNLGLMWQEAFNRPATLPSVGGGAVYRLSNQGATLENGEPTVNGLMHNTIWGKLSLRWPARVVVHTFGSSLDTVLAAYRGTTISSLVRLAANDNRAVPGLSTTHSLIQFDITTNTAHSVQLGSKVAGTTGDLNANVYVFPLMGGLSAFLATINGFAAQPGDYVCGYRDLVLAPCGSPKFIVHNSTYHTLVVTASHNLGAGITTPAQVSLAPGALTTMQFQITGAFDQNTVRTVAGFFTFTGRVAGTAITVADYPALIVVKPTGAADVLRATITPQVRAGRLNEAVPFDVRLTNTGAQAAIGCHAHRAGFNLTRAGWQRLSSAGALTGAANVPFTVPAGGTVSFRVGVSSLQSRIADATFVGTTQPFTIDCANTSPAPITLANSFDITARGGYDPARVIATKLAPAGGVLDVPAGGAGLRVQAVNLGPAATLIARPSYERPFAECCDATKQFTVKVCRTNAAGACTTAEFDTIEFGAVKDAINRFKVIVRPPAVNPGYAPGLRRVFLTFAQVQPIGFVHSVPVAAQSIAVRKN